MVDVGVSNIHIGQKFFISALWNSLDIKQSFHYKSQGMFHHRHHCRHHDHHHYILFWKEDGVLFNDTLNTFYLQLYGIRHMVKHHSDRQRGNLLPPHRLLFSISSIVFYMHHPTDRITHTTAFVIPVVEHWLEQDIAQWVHHERTLLPWGYISLS